MSDGLVFDASDLTEWGEMVAAAPPMLQQELLHRTSSILQSGSGFARALATRNTGKMAGSIQIIQPARYAGGVVTGSYGPTATSDRGFPYPVAVERGRRGFSARPGGVLAFTIGGRKVFTKRVGPAAARPFMRPSVAKLRPIMLMEYRFAVRSVMARMGGA